MNYKINEEKESEREELSTKEYEIVGSTGGAQSVRFTNIEETSIGGAGSSIGNRPLDQIRLCENDDSIVTINEHNAIEEREVKEIERTEEDLLNYWDWYFEEKHEELAKDYKGKYVAIYNDMVIDSDKDVGLLAKRVYGKLGYKGIFMPYITS